MGDDLSRLAGERGPGPGDRLPQEVELARTLRVSRSKLREALTGWQRMGVVSPTRVGHRSLHPIGGGTPSLTLAVTLETESLPRTVAVHRPLEIEAVRLTARSANLTPPSRPSKR